MMSHRVVTCRSYGRCVIIHNNRKEQRAAVWLPRRHIELASDVTACLIANIAMQCLFRQHS